MRVKSLLAFFLFIALWPLIAITTTSYPATASESYQSADSLHQYATSLLQSGDTTGATAVLDRALKLNKKNYEALLTRGWLYLAEGDNEQAKLTFRDVLFSKSKKIRARAYVGIGDAKSTAAHRLWDAVIKEYKMAIKLDPENLAIYIYRAHAALSLDEPLGYRIASEMFLHVICRDPLFKDAYETWREKILDKSHDEMRLVTSCLENYLKNNPHWSSWLFDIAQYGFEMGDFEAAMDALQRLAEAAPEYKPAERCLLRARCLVELEDTLGFYKAYKEALAAARRDGDFRRLVAHAEAIFQPEEQEKAESIETAEQWADFFSVFWGRRDPDPLTPHNERLYEHYRRLSYARKKWPMIDVYSRTRESRTLDRMETFLSWNDGDGGAFGVPYADPGIFWNRCPELNLQQRGLLYVRHGPPDLINKPILEKGGRINAEVWYYGRVFFPFKEGGSSIGDYRYTPVFADGMGNVKITMETDSFKDPLPELTHIYYTTDFKSEEGLLEIEVYQSIAAEKLDSIRPEGVSITVLDSSWRELARDSSPVLKAEFDSREHWVGMNRVRVAPGSVVIAARLDAPGIRAVRRRNADLSPFGSTELELSGVVLGSPVPPSGGTHSRLGVELLPRPSLAYTAGEIMTVYLEVYGLGTASDGSRKYIQSVTIVRKAGDQGVLSKVKNLFSSGGRKRTSSLTLTFERQPIETTAAVPENFNVDTSLLLPGDYQMLIEISDSNGNGSSRQAGCTFLLAEPE